jgi:hypothetical protein
VLCCALMLRCTAKAKLLPVHVSVAVTAIESGSRPGGGGRGVVTAFTIEANTTAPYTFLSSELPGTFSDNSLTLRPGEKLSLEFASEEGGVTADGFLKSCRVYTMNMVLPQHLAPPGDEEA